MNMCEYVMALAHAPTRLTFSMPSARHLASISCCRLIWASLAGGSHVSGRFKGSNLHCHVSKRGACL